MSTNLNKIRVGDLRPNQLLFTFGVGSIVDLPNLTVMVMGLDDWPTTQGSEIHEERLLTAVRKELGEQVARLLTPPITSESVGVLANPFDEGVNLGVPVAPFPRWVVCPYCRLLAPLGSGLFQLKIDPYRRDRTRYIHANCSKPGRSPAVVPARFLVACEHGHLDDFPWIDFVHQGANCQPLLRLYELGASGEASDVMVKCDRCQKTRSMAVAFGEEGKNTMPRCRGRWPHLRTFDEDGCSVEHVTTILLGASNSWFPMTLSALSIPSATNKLDQLIDQHWAILGKATSKQNIELLRQIGQLRAFAQYSDDQIWEVVERKRSGTTDEEDKPSSLKEPEWQIFSNPDPNRNSRLLSLREVEIPTEYTPFFDKVVLVEQLREVRSLIGFTRIDSPGDYSEPGELPEEQRAPLSRKAPTWVPTSEVRGEGIFIQFSEDMITTWVQRLKNLDAEFFEAHRQWRKIRGLEPELRYPTLRYVLVHSFAHALMRQLALECGYTMASLRERIYAQPADDQVPMAGVLI